MRKKRQKTHLPILGIKSPTVLKEASNHKPFYDNKFENLDSMDKFMEKHDLQN